MKKLAHLALAAALMMSSDVGAATLISSQAEAPPAAKASGATDDAVTQCGNGVWEWMKYPTYQDCYTVAIYYYFDQTSGGRGYGIPDYRPWTGCGAAHLACYPNN